MKLHCIQPVIFLHPQYPQHPPPVGPQPPKNIRVVRPQPQSVMTMLYVSVVCFSYDSTTTIFILIVVTIKMQIISTSMALVTGTFEGVKDWVEVDDY